LSNLTIEGEDTGSWLFLRFSQEITALPSGQYLLLHHFKILNVILLQLALISMEKMSSIRNRYIQHI
jgi:hypothetical protein